MNAYPNDVQVNPRFGMNERSNPAEDALNYYTNDPNAHDTDLDPQADFYLDPNRRSRFAMIHTPAQLPPMSHMQSVQPVNSSSYAAAYNQRRPLPPLSNLGLADMTTNQYSSTSMLHMRPNNYNNVPSTTTTINPNNHASSLLLEHTNNTTLNSNSYRNQLPLSTIDPALAYSLPTPGITDYF